MKKQTPLFQARSRCSIPIWDLEGELTGSRALQLKEALLDFFKEGGRELLLNFKKVTSLDALAAHALNESMGWGLNLKGIYLMSSLRYWLNRDLSGRSIPLYSQEEDALKSFAGYRAEGYQEKRSHPRIETNIPVEMRIGGKAYRGVVLNISEGGALVGYLDAIDEAEVLTEGVNLELELPERLHFVMAEGEVMKFHSHRDMPAMGIKYTNLEEESKKVIRQIVQGGV